MDCRKIEMNLLWRNRFERKRRNLGREWCTRIKHRHPFAKETTTSQSKENKPILDRQVRAEFHQLLIKELFSSFQLIVNLKIIEVKLELGMGSSTRPVLTVCLFVQCLCWYSKLIIGGKFIFHIRFSIHRSFSTKIDSCLIIRSSWIGSI